jgi:hypothetical protein
MDKRGISVRRPAHPIRHPTSKRRVTGRFAEVGSDLLLIPGTRYNRRVKEKSATEGEYASATGLGFFAVRFSTNERVLKGNGWREMDLDTNIIRVSRDVIMPLLIS